MNQSKLITYNLDFILLQIQQSSIHNKEELIKWRDNLAVYKRLWHYISEPDSIESLARDVYKEIQLLSLCVNRMMMHIRLLLHILIILLKRISG